MWDEPYYDPDYVEPPKPTRRDHYCTDPTWRTLQPGGPFRMLGWQTFTRYGQRNSYRDICELIAGEEHLDSGRFRLFQYEECEHEVELGPVRDDGFCVTEWQQSIDHRGSVFDWIHANVRHAWNFDCELEAYGPLSVFFSFADPQEAMLFKLAWG